MLKGINLAAKNLPVNANVTSDQKFTNAEFTCVFCDYPEDVCSTCDATDICIGFDN